MKRMKKASLIIAAVFIIATAALCGCGDRGPDETRKYVVFENTNGDEEVEVSYPGTYTVEYEYNEFKEYDFRYTAYYKDNDMETGESGRPHDEIQGNKPGNYYLRAPISIPGKGYEEYVLKVVIKEKPDLRVDPHVRFDPNGATVEERNGDTIFVYKYDYRENNNRPFPILELYDNGTKIKSPTSTELGSKRYIQESIEVNSGTYDRFPIEVGLYRVYYRFSNYIESEKEKYKPVSVNILVEIQE